MRHPILYIESCVESGKGTPVTGVVGLDVAVLHQLAELTESTVAELDDRVTLGRYVKATKDLKRQAHAQGVVDVLRWLQGGHPTAALTDLLELE